MPTIQTLTGNINFRDKSAMVCVFHSPRKGGAGNKEVWLDKASKSGVTSSVVRRVGEPSFTAAIPGTKQDIGGRFVRQTFDLAEGEIIKVFVNVRPGYGRMPRTGNVFLRVRQNAAYRRLRFAMIDHADAAHTSAEIEGTFDVLSLDSLEAAGVHIPTHFRQSCSLSVMEKILTENTIIHPEISAAVRVRKRVRETADGAAVVTFEKKRRRALDI